MPCHVVSTYFRAEGLKFNFRLESGLDWICLGLTGIGIRTCLTNLDVYVAKYSLGFIVFSFFVHNV